LFTEKLT